MRNVLEEQAFGEEKFAGSSPCNEHTKQLRKLMGQIEVYYWKWFDTRVF